MPKELWEIVGSGKASGQSSKGDDCSFRHDVKKAQPIPSPRSSTRQNVRNASRTRSPRGRSPSGRKNVSTVLQGFPQRNLHQFIL